VLFLTSSHPTIRSLPASRYDPWFSLETREDEIPADPRFKRATRETQEGEMAGKRVHPKACGENSPHAFFSKTTVTSKSGDGLIVF